MKKIITVFIISFFGNTYAQITETCATGTIKLKTQNHQYGTLEWQTSQDGIKWNNIHNAHDTTYVFTTSKAAYYRAVNKFPNCEPIISSTTLVQRPPIANAGEDRLVNDDFLFLAGNSSIGSTGNWSIIEGTGGAILEPTNRNSKFTGTTGNYKLLWTLQNACGTSQDTLNVNFVNNQYHNKIVIIDDTDTILSSSTELANGNYNIQFNTPVPVIDNETILVGTVGNGFLRKVNTVSQSGNTFTMTTSQGKLSDLLIDGGFDLGSVVKIDSILPASRMAHYKRLNRIPTRAQILSNPNLQTGVHYFIVNETESSNYSGIQMQRSSFANITQNNPNENTFFKFTFDNTLLDELGFNIKLEGDVTFTPNVYAYYNKSILNPIIKLGINNSTLVSDYKFTMQHTSSNNLVENNFELFNYDKLVYFLVGGVPIIINTNVKIEGTAKADVNSNMTFTHEFENTITTNAGIKYENDEWTYHYTDDVQTTIDNNLNLTGSLEQNFEIGPSISFKVYDIIGPYVEAKLTEDLNICASTINGGALNWKANLNLGGKFTIGARAEINDYNLFDFSKTWEDRELYSVNFPHSIEYHSGNNQQYIFGNPLANSIKVRVMSNKGFPVPGVVVKFEPETGSGLVTDTFVFTDANGYAQTSWSPTGTNGFAKLKAIVQDCDQNNILHSPLVFDATENVALNCTQSTLFANYVISGNLISPSAHMGIPPYTYSTDGTNFSSLIPQITMTTGGNYTATVKDSNGCTATINYYNGPVNCNNSGLNLQTSVYGSNITASAQNGNPPYLFALDNGSYSAISTFNSLSIGNHLIRVKDTNNCVRQSIISISNSTNDLVAYFSVNSSTLITNFPIEFTNLSANATSYLWNFGNSITSTLENPTCFYSTAGTYTVILTASFGTQQSTFTQTITITNSTNTLNIATVAIPAGTFMMGSPSTEPGRYSDEVLHQVTLSAFSMSKYEITCAQYAVFLNNNGVGSNAIWTTGPYPTQPLITADATYGLTFISNQWTPAAGKANSPMTRVNWFGAVSFAQYAGGRLPTESEWEYAARGGTTTAYNTGACLNNTQANYYWANPQAGCTNTTINNPNTTQNVGNYGANAYGLYDMHGNVREWCQDWYGTYPTVTSTNPIGPATGTHRVLRGGTWNDFDQSCRSAKRNSYAPTLASYYYGFRIVF